MQLLYGASCCCYGNVLGFNVVISVETVSPYKRRIHSCHNHQLNQQ